MATLVFGLAGAAIGPALFGGGISLLGATLTGAQLGGALGYFAGSTIDAALFGGGGVKREGPRLTDLNIQASTEGAPVPRVWGRVRVAGQLVWASKFRETVVTTTQSAGGKGTPKTTVKTKEYRYSISFAVGLCEGRITRIGRIWADGKLMDLSNITMRVYDGAEDQLPDPLIEETEGAGNTPAYRGLAYVVFEDLELARFGNRIPQLQFEIVRAVDPADAESLERRAGGVALIPGSGEFVYADGIVAADDGKGTTAPQNFFNASGVADMTASLDELAALAPNLGAVALVVGWFGNDLRAGEIAIRPGVETSAKNTHPLTWRVNGVTRAGAHVVSEVDGRPAYGGTPSDATVIAAIAAIKARGWRVLFYPFLFLDIPPGNVLPDPYSDNAAAVGQPAHPWRGRITISPAPGYAGSPDKTAAAATEVAAFFGNATASGFAVNGTDVTWTGGADWGWRRMVLHYAHLCAAAGGVDAFVIGSEFRALTRARSAAATYPAAAELADLAGEVRSVLGAGTKLGYAADWSEYHSHQTGDAPGAVLFHLDALWADADIDFIGIDNYMPLADWRDGTAHADYDAANGPVTIHDRAYLAGNIRGGEYYDWYYAGDAARAGQARTPIADAAYGKAWVWRVKDIWGWWANAHYDRPDGTESPVPTAWVPQSKPVWFTELGCPAVDKGANQPNVFYDPKSAESALPHFSNGGRDDLVQRRFLEAHLSFWNDPANNPESSLYAGRMVDVANVYLWAWDARPWPFFPARADIWGDAPNWRLGHWLNGRLGAVMLPDLVREICEAPGFADYDVSALQGLVTGFLIDRTMSARAAIEPLGLAFHFDGVETEGAIRFVMRGRAPAAALGEEDLVLPDGGPRPGLELLRAQETELPQISRVAYIDMGADYRQAVAESHRLVTPSRRVAESALPLVLDQSQAIGIGERILQDAWVMREHARFALPPSRLALDPGDEVLLDAGGRVRRLRLEEISDAGARAVAAVATDPSIYEWLSGPDRIAAPSPPSLFAGRALAVFLDLPLLTGAEVAHAPHVAAFASPWPGGVLVWRSPADAGYEVTATLTAPARIGETLYDFHSGPTGRWDKGNALYIALYGGTLSSKTDAEVLAGANALAIANADGEWEVLQFAEAELIAPGQWRLSRLLRGQAGSERAMRDPVAAGARIVVLDAALAQPDLSREQYALPFHYRWGPQGRDLADPAYQGAVLQFSGAGLRPLSPVHVRARWIAGDIHLSWIRRTRIGGDDFAAPDIPLGEEAELYEVDILDGAAVRRTLAVSQPSAVYTAAMQAADFGGPQWQLSLAVYQVAPAFGRGTPRFVTLYY